MVNANPFRRWSPLVRPLSALFLALAAGGALAAQVCKYDSIAATAPASRFTDNRDGTVTDQATGLQWKRCSEGQTWSGGTCTGNLGTYNWQEALQRADTASFAGKSDWRLPNVNELASIVEEACYDPAIVLSVFPATPSVSYWSSSSDAYLDEYAWYVNFTYGIDRNYGKWGGFRIRLVRGGQ